MGDSRSDTVYFDSQKSSEQFDYFIMGLISAIVAYLAQNVKEGLISSPSYDINLVAMLSLLFSMYSGFVRIEQVILGKMLNHRLLYLAESRGKLVDFLNSNPNAPGLLNTETGEHTTRQQAQEQIGRYTGELANGQPRVESVKAKTLFYYKARNRSFIAGFLGVFIAKVLLPYIH